ncbi:hypothetical protein [Cryobacterium sp. Y57]|uniref:hypothetical protein n=1 Tax=Cryobacterium sp. Y57 TaxID=2048287 RepID=UPI000CE475E1|nr:hypothetical protein [Cryobacterium sp. Y57]
MNATRDDDALNWAGDDDPTLATGDNGKAAPNTTALPEGWTLPHQTVSANRPGATGQTTDADTTAADTAAADITAADITAADTTAADITAADTAAADITAADTAAADGAAADTAAADGAALSSAALVGMGVLAGMYLLYTIGWFIGVARIENSVTDPVTEFMFSLGAWLAVGAPLAWFGATYWLTMSRPRARLIWLLIGVIVLAPLPFISGSGAGS